MSRAIWLLPLGLWVSALIFKPNEMQIIGKAAWHATSQVLDLAVLILLTGGVLYFLIWRGLLYYNGTKPKEQEK